MSGRAKDIAGTYRRQAVVFAAGRSRGFGERAVFEALLRRLPVRSALDLGCGSGRPVAAFLACRGTRVTGVDGSAPMLDLFAQAVPGARAVLCDMRRASLKRRFGAVIAWDSFFHLPARDQAAMFGVLRRHASPGGLLLFNTGPAQGVAIGKVGAEAVFHASLSPARYRRLLARNGFTVLAHRRRDPTAGGRTWWLACLTGAEAVPRRHRRRPSG